ncbi:putative tRNA adenosine deaminase-associated protein [Thermocatellispora tengchongensis]|uniref:Putative tRNA adenosine deaminase-associated protein n=1 Tax=Thermocatellispora tengchongensis TaxID=1073253 RepID=A0A840NPH6_9ACTN|nr:tRNA adenosine deaminase-associated protein [Thermocatellispora tengchongensis]MBB5130424.1 putative tRNA adenosine deaminase-associated protein [Thermocatellispora tengchongensis]
MPSRPSGNSVFSAAFVRTEQGWNGAEVDLDDAEIVDDLGDAVQESLGLTGDELVLLCVEVEDEWFAIVRYEGDEEPRVFLSDAQAGVSDPLGALFTELAGVAPDKESADLGVRPAGDFELLSDLGVTSEELLELSMEEGVLPADTLSVIAERLDFADELDRLH